MTTPYFGNRPKRDGNGPFHPSAQSLSFWKLHRKVSSLRQFVSNLLCLHHDVFDSNVLNVFATRLPRQQFYQLYPSNLSQTIASSLTNGGNGPYLHSQYRTVTSNLHAATSWKTLFEELLPRLLLQELERPLGYYYFIRFYIFLTFICFRRTVGQHRDLFVVKQSLLAKKV